MSELASIHLRQGRAFIKAGNPGKAIELLEKAAALTANDPQIHRQTMEELARAYEFAGRIEQAQRCREQLPAPTTTREDEPPPDEHRTFAWPNGRSFRARSHGPSRGTLLLSHLAVALLSGVGVYLAMTRADHKAASAPLVANAAEPATTVPPPVTLPPGTASRGYETPQEIAEHYEGILQELRNVATRPARK